MSDPFSPSLHLKRPRGAQPGNKNAVKRNLYVNDKRFLDRLENDMKGSMSDEIIALRCLADKTMAVFGRIKDPTLEQCLSTSYGVGQLFDRIRSLSLAQKLLYNNQSSMEQVLDVLARIPPEQD